MTGPDNPFELEVIRRKLESLCHELGNTLRTVSRTEAVRALRDYAVAIADARGEIIAVDDPTALGTLESALTSALRRFRFDLHEGDLIVLSDPYAGGLTTNDLFLIAPHQVAPSLRVFCCLRVAVPDLGGEVPGGCVPHAREIWAEGVPITPLKLRRGGRPVRDAQVALALNSRAASDIEDILATATSLTDLGGLRVAEICSEYGASAVASACAYALDYAERYARTAIADWSPGTYEGASRLENDGSGGTVVVRVKLSVSDELIVDLGDSDAQRPTFLNCTSDTAAAYAKLAVAAFLGPNVPVNSGLTRVVSIATGAGRVTSAQHPAGVGAGKRYLGMAIADAVAQALQQATGAQLEDLGRRSAILRLQGPSRELPVVNLEAWNVSGCSAAYDRDGWGAPHVLSRPELPSVEQWELADSVFVEMVELVMDTAGPGELRGSPSLRLVVELLGPRTITYCSFDNLAASKASAGSAVSLSMVRMDGTVAEPSVGDHFYGLERGSKLVVDFAGGHGVGDPVRRSAERVARDVLDEIVSADQARALYDHAYGA